MAHADFVHLRARSAYSLLEGAIKTPALIELARANGMPALGVCDRGNLFGALEFAMAAAKAGIQPIIGCQLGVRRESAGEGASGSDGGPLPPPDRLVLLVQDAQGWQNLSALVSRAFLETDPPEIPQISFDVLERHAAGLIALTAGPEGEVGRLLAEEQPDEARTALTRLAKTFPGRLYVELMRHGVAVEDRIEDGLLDLAYALDLPLVATNGIFFADAEMYEAHDALICIAESTYVTAPDRRRLTPEYRFKSAAEMRTLFADLPEAVDNTLAIARRCAFMPEPVSPILPPFQSTSGRPEAEEVQAQAQAGLEERLRSLVFTPAMDEAGREAVAAPYRDRLAYELKVIVDMGFAGYFLIVADFIQWAKREGIPVGPGRGSGAGSVVAWALTITDLDPLRFNLLFERFLNPDRVSMPDFDIDFCQDRRDAVIHYVQDRYGRDRVAQIITFGKLQARAVLRDVGRVLQLPYGLVDRICKLVPNNPANPVTLQQAIDGEPQLQEARRTDEAVGRMMGIALKLEGLYRHASTHAAGVVIGDRPLHELVPLYRDPRSDMPVTQFNMKYVELAGLVKFDFLGLKTLTVLQRCIELLQQRGVEVDLTRIPLDDPETYRMLARAEAVGVFQFESSGMRRLLQDAQPTNIEDLIALVALYRPGPMENIPKYVACKHGREQPEQLHPLIDPVVRDTYGVIIYQEQVMQIAQVFAGYSLGQADLLRRAMGKKIKAEMEAQREIFVRGAVAKGVEPDRASYVFDLVDKFAGYGFNKAHSAGYALVAYQTAWCKANHPVEFLAASMALDIGSTDKLNMFRREADRLGIKVLPPDVNSSQPSFTVETGADGCGAVRYALAALKGVGMQAMETLAAERRKGPFRDLAEFAVRVGPGALNRRQVETLARAGAFDSLNGNRAQAMAAAETIVRHAQAAAEERESRQHSLFGGGDASMPAMPLPAIEDWLPTERLQHEFDAIGFYLSAHPLEGFEQPLKRLGVTPISDVTRRARELGGDARVRLAGAVVGRQERVGRNRSRYAILTLSDPSGMVEAWMFSEVLAQSRELLDAGGPLLVVCDARADGDSVRVTVQSAQALDEVAADTQTGLAVWVRDMAALPRIRTVLERERRGRGRVNLILRIGGDTEVELALPARVALSPDARAALRSLPGVTEVRDL